MNMKYHCDCVLEKKKANKSIGLNRLELAVTQTFSTNIVKHRDKQSKYVYIF